MSKTYLLAGASGAMAIETAKNLRAGGHRVIGISTKDNLDGYDELYKVQGYDFGQFPALESAISGLVYFPGTINLKPFARLGAADFGRDMQVNALGAAAFAQAYLASLKQAEDPAIVFISTVAVQLGLPFHSSIAMAKGALEGLTVALAAELAPGIRVNAVAPSLVDTPLSEKLINTPEKLEQMQKRNPLRKLGAPADLANAICFLLSPQAQWITGQVLAVDGGMRNIKN